MSLYLSRKWWHLWWRIRNPRTAYCMWRKWRKRPKVGDVVEDCRNELHTVVSIGPDDDDYLVFEDGHTASWMHCCDTVEEHNKRNGT